MTDRNRTLDRDEVLFAFHEAYARPTVDQIIEWTSRYPQFADDIRAHAAVSWDWAERKELPSEKPSESMLDRAFSRALNALYNAELETTSIDRVRAFQSFQEILSACGKDVPSLTREIGGSIGIARSVLADLVNGAMRAPVAPRFLDAMTSTLSITADSFYAALQRALSEPRLGQAKANTTPTVKARSYEEVILSSGMTSKQVQYWLGKD